MRIIYHNKAEFIHIENEFPLELFDFANILKKLVGVDVFNFDNLKCLVTTNDYDITEDHIYDKATGKELVLKRMDYAKECGAGLKMIDNTFHLDFSKKELITYDNGKRENKKIKLKSKDIEKIISLIKKYGIYKWNSIEFSNKAISEGVSEFEICSWRLSLAFEEGQVLNFGGKDTYQDTYIDFGKELIKLFRIDLLRIEDKTKFNNYLV